MGGLVELLHASKVDEFSLCFIQLEFYCFQPDFDMLHGFFHDGNAVAFWWCIIGFVGVGCLWFKGSPF